MRVDNDEFERIVRTYQARLNAFARRMTRSREDAEEVVQDTFLRAFRSLNAMSLEQRHSLPLRPWLYTIARNAALNQIRKGRRACASLEAFEDVPQSSKLIERQTPESIVLEYASLEEAEKRLRRLPRHLRETARLRFVDDCSISQIAYACNKPLGTVKSHLHRAVVSMRRAMARVA